MTDPHASPVMGLPVLDVPHPQRVVGQPQEPARAEAPSGPPQVAFPSAKKTIVGSAPDETAEPPVRRPALASAQKTIVGSAPGEVVELPARGPRLGSAQKTIVGTGFELETFRSDGLRPTIPETPSSMRPPPPAKEETSSLAIPPVVDASGIMPPKPQVAFEPTVEVPTTSASPALWLLLVALFALVAGVIYTL